MRTPGDLDSSARARDVAAGVRLLHHRRGWLWTGAVSGWGLTAYAAITASYGTYLTGSVRPVTTGITLFLGAVAGVALIIAAADTLRLRRAGAETMTSVVKASRSFTPSVHPYRHEPGHQASWLAGWLVLLAVSIPSVLYAPAELAAVRTLAGFQLASSAGLAWPMTAPLSLALPARALTWVTGSGPLFFHGFGTAVDVVDVGLIFDGFAALMFAAVVSLARRRRRDPATQWRPA
jgi:hypothetical protein